MKIKKVQVKSVVTKSKLPDADYVINPYTGCEHGCKYCYARFMKRFTGHKEEWGEFVDVKENAVSTISDKYKGANIVIGSVTDPYQPIEARCKLTRAILKRLIALQPELNILTKSDLVVRDVDLIKQFKKCEVAISLSMLDDKVRDKLEKSVSAERRIAALKKLHENGIKTVLFISPIFPSLTEWKKMIELTKSYVDECWFENINLYPSIKDRVGKYVKNVDWGDVEEEIRKYCKEKKVKFKIYFHHGK